MLLKYSCGRKSDHCLRVYWYKFWIKENKERLCKSSPVASFQPMGRYWHKCLLVYFFFSFLVSIQSPTKNHYTSSTSEAVPPPTLTQNQAFSVPPGHAVCCFLDGGVGLYDMGAKKWDFLRDLVCLWSFFYIQYLFCV